MEFQSPGCKIAGGTGCDVMDAGQVNSDSVAESGGDTVGELEEDNEYGDTRGSSETVEAPQVASAVNG